MKLPLVFFAFVALAASSVIPKDKNHYETESRHLWVPDAEGNPLLVEPHEAADAKVLDERSGFDNQYWLYTRLNSNRPQIITHGNEQSIWASHYLGSRPIKVIIHGYAGNGNSDINSMLTSAWLFNMDANVIVVDWSKVASGNYIVAVNQAPVLGRAIGNFLTWLIDIGGGNWNNVHITGFSLGGQIAGIAGRAAGGRARRITSLDPMSPLWYNNAECIRSGDGQYVEIIHTYYTRASSPLIGHADFYPNGGNGQPGCLTNLCSHLRSINLFASSIRTNHFVGRQCVDRQQAVDNNCTGPALNMGNSILNKTGSGFYALSTGRSWPF